MPADRTVANSIDEYIAAFPQDIQQILQKIRSIVHEIAPDAKEKISYGMPAFTLDGNLVYFAAFQHHIGFYPTPSGTDAFQKELTPYKHAKGSIQFPLDKPIPYDLIRQITEFRVKETREKAATKKKK
jgi:uncharacterized protein YdhG (YjbR/CyaY superfamily)